MKSFKRIFILCLFSCLVISGCAYAQDNNNYVIFGNFGVEGVEMIGLPGTPVTDSRGRYRIEVPSGWSGKIVPQKEGYVFQPASRDYNNITEDKKDQDYKAEPIMCIISGTTGIEGVEMIGFPGHVVTGADGSYSVIVSYNFSGTVIPKKEGYYFQPPSIVYTNVVSDKKNQDYKASVKTYTISGRTGVEGVRMEGFPGNVFTDRKSFYSVVVPYGWSGTVKPQKNGYNFEPNSRIYNKVKENYSYDNYVSEAEDYTISGTIVSDKGEPVEDVVLTSNGVNPIVTDDKGQYSFEVEYGWSGVIKPEHQAYTFSPALMRYSRVQRDMANQNYKAQTRMLTISETLELNNRPIPGVKATANPGNIQSITDSKGQFSIQVPYGWSGEITFTSTRPGLDIFSSPGKQYSNVTTDIINGISVPPTNVMGMSISQSSNLQTPVKSTGGRKILVVPSNDIDSKDIAETKEDLLVMAEILDERFREPRLIEGVLRDFGDFFGRDNKQTDAIHIQDYGVIFMMEVNCQFSSLSKSEEKVETRTNSDTDQTWQQARQRVLSPETISSGNRDYEVQMVNILKTELIRTLKYASNIRNIKPDEWVILSVSGVDSRSWPLMGGGSLNSYPSFGGIRPNNSSGGYGSGYGGGAMVEGSYGSGSGYGGGSFSGGYEFGVSSYGVMNTTVTNNQNTSSAASVMTMRVKKSDVDEFANETIDFEQFRDKIEILLY